MDSDVFVSALIDVLAATEGDPERQDAAVEALLSEVEGEGEDEA